MLYKTFSGNLKNGDNEFIDQAGTMGISKAHHSK